MDEQWANWKKFCTPPGAEVIGGGEDAKEASATADEAEPLEQALSNFLAAKASRQRLKVAAPLLLQAEDAARVAKLPPDNLARLQTAARGAAEKSLVAWKMQFEQIVRGNLQEATPATLKQRLAGFENFNNFHIPGDKPQQQTLWKKTVETELTPEQRAAWQKEVDARKLFRETTIVEAVLAEFDRQVPLRTEQWDKLKGMMIKITSDYSEEIQQMFNYNEGNAWYLQTYTRFLPLAGLPEEELKSILGKEQWERWAKTDEYNNAKNYWNNIKQNRQNRVLRR